MESLILSNYCNGKERSSQIAENSQSHKIVSERIKEIINDNNFSMSPIFLKDIHNYIFRGIFAEAGEYRHLNITKKEFILNGDSVRYAPYNRIEDYLGYDFKMERKYKYSNKTLDEMIRHIVVFNSRIWETHSFMDGNTRCVEVFMVKYLRNFGFKIDNDLYKRYALYYRNALVRSCYSNDGLNISSTDDYLIRFYHNLLMNTNYKLQSRDLIVEELYNPKIKMLIK